MEPIHLFELTSRKNAWLAARQATVAGNIANANTPGYKTKDVSKFADVLEQTQMQLASTNAAHLSLDGSSGTGDSAARDQVDGFDVTESGNSVGMEEELMKANEVQREYSLSTGIVKSFHAMLMNSLKG